MRIERCSNKDCNRPFEVSEYKLQMPGTKEREDISCPHCGYTYTQISNGFFRMRSGNAWFIRKDGKVILMAENIKENASALTRFKRAERQRTGAKSIKRGQEIPIAVLVPRVTLKRRFDFDGTVRRAMPQLAQSINRYLNRN